MGLIRVVHDDYFWGAPSGHGKRHSVLPHPPVSKPLVTLNGVAQSVGIKGLDIGCAWYYAKWDAVLTQDPATPSLIDGDAVRIDYDAMVDATQE